MDNAVNHYIMSMNKLLKCIFKSNTRKILNHKYGTYFSIQNMNEMSWFWPHLADKLGSSRPPCRHRTTPPPSTPIPPSPPPHTFATLWLPSKLIVPQSSRQLIQLMSSMSISRAISHIATSRAERFNVVEPAHVVWRIFNGKIQWSLNLVVGMNYQ